MHFVVGAMLHEELHLDSEDIDDFAVGHRPVHR
jgi:hypothetical protein